MKQTVRKIIAVSMIAVSVLWLIAIFVLYIGALDEVWGLLAFVLIVPYFIPFLIGILTILGYVRSILSENRDGNDRVLTIFTTVTAMVFAFLSLTVLALGICRGADVFPETSPLGMLYAAGVLTRMTFAFAALTLLSSLIGGIFGILIRKLRSESHPRLPMVLRTTAILLTTVIILCVLLVPVPAGSYNDGGSKIYEAVLYDVVDWNRTQQFDGTPFHEEGQRMRIYFFPQNCYDYDMRWDLRH